MFFKNIIYHALYILNKNSTNDVLIGGCYIYDFLWAYYIIHIFKDFFAGLNKYFHVTFKEGPQLSYLNICIIQSPYVISIDKTYHIHNTILAQWFTYASDKLNYVPNPFK